jgi:predicted metal-binding membrane protein
LTQLVPDGRGAGLGRASIESSSTPLKALAAIVTLGIATASWVVAVRSMDGMHMGVATKLGPFSSFMAFWVSMMAAMMLPGAVPAVVRRAQAIAQLGAVPMFVASYLAVWTLVGALAYVLYRPHGSLAAGVTVVAAGLYEFTPLKRASRRHCRGSVHSGFRFGLYCAGSSIGLMLMLLALGVMSVTWMIVIAALVLAQKLLAPKAGIDVPVALAIIGLGVLILATPSSVPGLTIPM